jgi:NitT/TauT family transport system permease protein
LNAPWNYILALALCLGFGLIALRLSKDCGGSRAFVICYLTLQAALGLSAELAKISGIVLTGQLPEGAPLSNHLIVVLTYVLALLVLGALALRTAKAPSTRQELLSLAFFAFFAQLPAVGLLGLHVSFPVQSFVSALAYLLLFPVVVAVDTLARTVPAFLILAVDFVLILTALARFAGLRVRAEYPQRKALMLTVSFVALLFLAWWFITRGERYEDRLINVTILASPTEVLRAFLPLHFEQALVRNALTSFQRVTFGFVLAAIVAIPLGTYMATFLPIAAFFRPLALIGAYVPVVVFIPLTIAWFGATEIQKIGFLFIVCFIALLPLVIKSVADVPAAYLDVAATKDATQWQLVRQVLLPVALADIWDHLRGVYGVGWTWIILAEVWANADKGLGYLLDISRRRAHIDREFMLAFVIVIIAVACDQAWRIGGRLLFPYKRA